MRMQVGVAMALGLLLAMSAFAEGTDDKPDNGKDKGALTLSATDMKFAKDAWMIHLAQVKLGELATKQAMSDEVKKFGQHMIDDHGKGKDELEAILKDLKVEPATELDKKQQANHDKLAKLTGEAFDKAFMKDAKRSHGEVLATFRAEAKKGKEERLKAYAEKYVPTLEQHQKHAAEVLAGLGKKK